MEVIMFIITKLFRNGNSQALRIPVELSYDRTDVPMLIERIGDELRVRPVQSSLAGVLALFAQFGSDFMAQGRAGEGEHEQRERDIL
jgi:antitoxin VapB